MHICFFMWSASYEIDAHGAAACTLLTRNGRAFPSHKPLAGEHEERQPEQQHPRKDRQRIVGGAYHDLS
jgi:hypothetical protein